MHISHKDVQLNDFFLLLEHVHRFKPKNSLLSSTTQIFPEFSYC